MKISIGVMAYNEEKNIVNVLTSLVKQDLDNVIIEEILVVSSGSTDATNELVKSFMKAHSIIKLIIEDTRKGKASAVNLFIESAREDVLVLMSADLLLTPNTVSNICRPLNDASIGIVGARPIPINSTEGFLGFTNNLLWSLHHMISLNSPKMGEMIAFRRVFKKIPQFTAVDEAQIEPLIRGQGYTSYYASDALVYNKGPETLKEFISRRRSIYAGHLSTKYEYSYEVATFSVIPIIKALFKTLSLKPKSFFYIVCACVLEIFCRILGYYDYFFNKSYSKSAHIWHIAESTKSLS